MVTMGRIGAALIGGAAVAGILWNYVLTDEHRDRVTQAFADDDTRTIMFIGSVFVLSWGGALTLLYSVIGGA